MSIFLQNRHTIRLLMLIILIVKKCLKVRLLSKLSGQSWLLIYG